eukprot:TRINITY_DN11518_c0_g1_i4.p1 TRINITY_DN11518_c0_g1~~TRINITY_DN11518_c0_g1_i4.p1  ORF type:complete len:468 (-),score=107.57 TRINITY_DN11518_c0_g1_i4:30-1433(-)
MLSVVCGGRGGSLMRVAVEGIEGKRDTKSDETREKRRQYRIKNKAATQLYYQNNKESIKQLQKQFRTKNKAALNLKNHLYRIQNKESISEKHKQYRQGHKEALQERTKIYYLLNKDKIKSRLKCYYNENRELIRMRKKEYRVRNKETIREVNKNYYMKNKGAISVIKRSYYLKHRNPKIIRRIWNKKEDVIQFFEYAGEQLFVRDPLDWYRISRIQIKNVGGIRLYSIFGNLGKALRYAFPEVDWDISLFSNRGKKCRQRWLRVILEQILPEKTEIYEDYLHPQLFWEETNSKMQLDIWVPRYKMALEYQGEHHYHDFCEVYGPSGTLSLCKFRDSKKKESCSQIGITLVAIPYWWDGKKESLAATLSQMCPDTFPQTHLSQIPLSPPRKGDFEMKENDTEISTLLMHGQVWNFQDPTGWYISEKLDGYRAFWDGSKLYSKNGTLFPIPLDFTHSFPSNICLDGELW